MRDRHSPRLRMPDLALFDFDGTITTRETFPDFMRFAVPPTRLAIGKVLLAPLIAGYRMGAIPGVRVRARIVRFGMRGMAEAHYLELGRRFANEVLPGVIRAEALDRIAWHRRHGDEVVVVSGGFDAYLVHWCAAHGLALACSSLEARDGRLTGAYRGAQCVREEKVRRVRERYDLAAFDHIHAYGDTKEDLEMLRIANRRYYQWREVA